MTLAQQRMPHLPMLMPDFETLRAVETPALVLDREALERNRRCGLRPGGALA